MSRGWLIVAVTLVLVALAAVLLGAEYRRARNVREALFSELAPVTLGNCDMMRVGDAHDGGYLLCRNLVGRAQGVYSYGINGTDEWGCQLARQLSIPLHQYDCFNTTVPPCAGANAFFHAACVGPRQETLDGRPFSTMREQIARNGDDGKPLVVKMDVEGSEWASLLDAPDAVLRNIDQLVVEFHGIEHPRFVATVRRLKQHFYVVNVHVNNYSCAAGFSPFSGEVFEVLFVNRGLAQVVQERREPRHHALDAPNAASLPDCQGSAAHLPDSALFQSWVKRYVRRTVFGAPFASF